MMLTREQVVQGTLDEWELFAELIAGLDEAQWSTSTRCDGWEVRDIAAHVAGSVTDALTGRFGSRTPEQQAHEGRGRSARETATELRGVAAKLGELLGALDDAAWASPSPHPEFTMGEGILGLWQEAWLHADDVRHAVRLPAVRGAGLPAMAEYLANRLARKQWGPVRLQLDGLPEIAVGEADGRTVQADPHRFVLVATGRADSAELGLDPAVNIYA